MEHFIVYTAKNGNNDLKQTLSHLKSIYKNTDNWALPPDLAKLEILFSKFPKYFLHD